jgi:hypothetical protein
MTWLLEIQQESHSQALVRAAMNLLSQEFSLAITVGANFIALKHSVDTKTRTKEKEH